MLIKVNENYNIDAIKYPQDVGKILINILNHENEIDQCKEHFWLIGLNTNHTINFIDLVSLGTLDEALIHPREVFRTAIYYGISALIIAHNHPSSNIEPSFLDITITKKLKMTGDIIGIPLLDHVIITNHQPDKVFSFADEKLL